MRFLTNPGLWAAVIGFAAAQPALAAPPRSIFQGSHAQGAMMPPAAGSERIISTFFHNTESGIVETAGAFTTIDSLDVTCPKANASCTVVIAANVQASGGANAGNLWAILPVVDSTYLDNGPVQGELLADATYSTGYELQTISVPPGKHTLSVQVYSYDGLTVGYQQIQYSMYKP